MPDPAAGAAVRPSGVRAMSNYTTPATTRSTGDPVARSVVTHKLVGAGDGATITPSGLPYTGSGIVVALPDYAALLTSPDGPTVGEWVAAVASVVTDSSAPRPRAFGAWQHDGRLYLDVVELWSDADEDDAVSAGRARGEIAVWHNGRQEEIATGGTGYVTLVDVTDPVSGQTTKQYRDQGM